MRVKQVKLGVTTFELSTFTHNHFWTTTKNSVLSFCPFFKYFFLELHYITNVHCKFYMKGVNLKCVELYIYFVFECLSYTGKKTGMTVYQIFPESGMYYRIRWSRLRHQTWRFVDPREDLCVLLGTWPPRCKRRSQLLSRMLEDLNITWPRSEPRPLIFVFLSLVSETIDKRSKPCLTHSVVSWTGPNHWLLLVGPVQQKINLEYIFIGSVIGKWQKLSFDTWNPYSFTLAISVQWKGAGLICFSLYFLLAFICVPEWWFDC